MSCEKYSGWLSAAELGELRAECERELLAHAMECEACREALGHARAVREFVDRGVESLVAGEPSPQFATNLRRRIAQDSEPMRFPWTAWAPVMAGALALAVLLAIMVTRKPLQNRSNPTVASAVSPIPAPSGALTVPAAGRQIVKRTESKHGSGHGGSARVATADWPKIIVPQGQLAAALQLSASVNSGRVDGNQLLAAKQEYEKPLEVKPIEIAPLERPALGDATENPANSIQF